MKLSKLFIFSIFILMLAFIITSCGKKQEETSGTKSNSEKELAEFIKNLETKTIPLFKEMNTAYWNASISGKK